MRVEVKLDESTLLIEALFHYKKHLGKQLSLVHETEDREVIDDKLLKLSKLASRAENQVKNMLAITHQA